MDGGRACPVSIYAVSPALGIDRFAAQFGGCDGRDEGGGDRGLEEARDGVPGLLEKFSTLSGDVAVVSRHM